MKDMEARQRQDVTDQRLDDMDERIDGMAQSIDSIDSRLDGMSRTLDGIAEALTQLGESVHALQQDGTTMAAERRSMLDHAQRIDRQFDVVRQIVGNLGAIGQMLYEAAEESMPREAVG